jgi:prepilin-type N-terminal cleavage/methylation domain-containing protein
MATQVRSPRSGFTLVEMLVVVAIIGILAAMVTAGVYRALGAAKGNKIAQELTQLHQAIEAYKQKFGDYPPNFDGITNTANLVDNTKPFARHLRKAFPRHQETQVTLGNVFKDSSGNFHVPDAAEALVFWLSGLWNDPRFPVSAGSGNAIVLLPLEESRLRDINGTGWKAYVPKDGKDAPYVYFENRTYSASSYTFNAQLVRPYKSSSVVKAGATTLPFANDLTYQIISAGLDGEFGDTTSTKFKVFPKGQWDVNDNGTKDTFENDLEDYVTGDRDNIANFSEGKKLEDHVE